jgi:HlyD family secretion protein
MFRVKLQLDQARLRKYEPFVKVGLPGMGYVRIDANMPWPPMLQWKLVEPSDLPWKPIESSESH